MYNQYKHHKKPIIMIPTLLIWLYKKYGRPFMERHSLSPKMLIAPVRNTVITLLFLTIVKGAFGQTQTLNYTVLHSGKPVGRMVLQKQNEGDDVFLKVASDVKMRFIFA